MATSNYRRTCLICQEWIDGSDYRVIGLDQSEWPAVPPVSLMAHAGCVISSGWRGCMLVRPGQELEMVAAEHAPFAFKGRVHGSDCGAVAGQLGIFDATGVSA